MDKPLALKLRPTTLDECLGQKHLIGDGKIFTNLIKNKKIFSMILYGKPGIGKTSIANCIANDLNIRYRSLNATINDKHDFQVVFEEAKLYDGMILILDEIHRLNKDKQDLLLPKLESGLITIIGMTTSNPYHSINPAIRSRCHLFELKPLSKDDIIIGIKRVIEKNILENVIISDDAINYIASSSGSDLRYAYNFLELAYYSNESHNITLDLLKSLPNNHSLNIDKDEDGYYDTLSAFQKSIRGSDVDASLHYLGRLIESGDIESICRRLSVICYEDIGLANSFMGVKLEAAINAALRVGLPEARIPLSNIVIEMALSPKSNSSEVAINKVIDDIKTGRCDDIPLNIRLNSKEYIYPHDYKNHWVKQEYMPKNIKNKKYYIPCTTSNYERNLAKIKDNLDKLKNK